MQERVDFFISHSHVEKQWAEWIAEWLEKEGYSTFWGDRDLNIGDKFMIVIQEYLEKADRLIAILSPSYLNSTYCQAEISAMLAKGKGKILPVKVTKEIPVGDLAELLYVDLYGVDDLEAKKRLLKAISKDVPERRRPKFPRSIDQKDIIRKFPGKLPISNVSLDDEPIVVGKEDKLNAIREVFSHNKVVSSNLTLSGLGGVGKTTIAKQYISRFGYLYDLIWWVYAATSETIVHAYRDLATEQKLINDKNDDSIAVVKKWMLDTSNWLFIFDDVTDYATLQPFIPDEHSGNILILSRKSLQKSNDIKEIAVDVLTIEQAKSLLIACGVNGTDADIYKLIETSGFLPLTLKMAANYIVNNKLSIREFLKLNPFSLNTYKTANTLSNLASVYKEQGDYSNALNYYYKALEINTKDGIEQYNYINIYLNIATIYQEIGDLERALEIYHKILDIRDHATNADTSDIAKTYNNIATIYLQQKEFDKAIHLYHKSIYILNELLGNDHTAIATVLNNIASVYTVLGDYVQAQEYNFKALSIRKKILGVEHPDTAASYYNMAEVCSLQGQYAKSLELFQKALNIYDKAVGKENSRTALIYKNIANIYQIQKRYEESLVFYSKALRIQEETEIEQNNELISGTLSITTSNDGTVVNILNLSESVSADSKSIELIDREVRRILKEIEQQSSEDFTLFNNYYSEIIRLVFVVQKELVFENDNKTEVCHYSKLSTLKYIIKQKNDKDEPRFRISNIAYLNDPSEGKVLLHILKERMSDVVYNLLFSNSREEQKMVQLPFSKIFIGSFSTAKNKLPMWTLYGDDSKGCCLVFDDYFFDEKNVLLETKKREDKAPQSQDLTLYKVEYLDIDNIDNSDPIIRYLSEISNILDKLGNILAKYESVKLWIISLLDKIRFLFKDFDYSYENEVRVIIHAEDEQIKIDDVPVVPRLYVELQRKLEYKEIILGSKIDKPAEVVPFLSHSGMVDKVTKSGIQYQ